MPRREWRPRRERSAPEAQGPPSCRRPAVADDACTVTNEPRWPVLSAPSNDSASAPLTSPTTIRSGLILSASRTRSPSSMPPTPSAFGGRVMSDTMCGAAHGSSRVSSSSTTRSLAGTSDRSEPNMVVFPVPVAPLIAIDIRSATAVASVAACARVSMARSTSSSRDGGRVGSLLTETSGTREMGGSTT